MTEFMFATGIENSYPTIRLPDGRTHRVDEMAKCGHYARWRDDFRLVKELGIEFLRYGPPLFSAHLGPGRYDWDFADETFRALRLMGITPIADLCHFGVPDWVGGFDNPDWPLLFAEYARAFAARCPWVRYYTPVNEIFVAATFSGQLGWWNERGTSDRGFVTALGNLCRANTLAMRAILEIRPDAVFIQSESSEYFHAAAPDVLAAAKVLNEKRFLSLDLTYGRPVNAVMYEYLMDNGMTRAEYHWFLENQVKANCVMGTDYYITNEHLVHADGRVTASGEILGYYVITRQYYDRYRLPVMHTETNLADADRSWDWLWKQWMNLFRLRQDGVPILGFTWYSLTDQVDWDTALREDNGHIAQVGLCDLDRNVRRVGEEYRKLIAQWWDMLPTGSESLGPAVMPPGLQLWGSKTRERKERGQGMGKERLAAFSDGVIAIIITIMVLELRVPSGDGWAALRPLVPVFLSYVLSFVYLGIYWNNHHHLLAVTERVNGGILWANMHLLFWLSLVPFATGWMGEHRSATAPTAAYGSSLLAASLAYWLLQRAILATQGPDSRLAAAVGRDLKGKLSPVFYTLAIALAFVRPWLADAVYVLVALMWLVPDRRIERIVSEAPGEPEGTVEGAAEPM